LARLSGDSGSQAAGLEKKESVHALASRIDYLSEARTRRDQELPSILCGAVAEKLGVLEVLACRPFLGIHAGSEEKLGALLATPFRGGRSSSRCRRDQCELVTMDRRKCRHHHDGADQGEKDPAQPWHSVHLSEPSCQRNVSVGFRPCGLLRSCGVTPRNHPRP